MSSIISVEGLSKAYRIGAREDMPDTLVSAAGGVLKAPWRQFSKLRRLNTFGAAVGETEDDILWALRDVSFEVSEGEVVGIIGRNGAGKSTLLKILSRITEPTSGRAVIDGRISSLLEVGTGFHPELTGRENIYMNGTILGMTKREIDGKFDEIVDFSGVEKFLDTPTKRYSSGMQVRLAFAVAAHLEPEILIIDEVLAVGDFEFQRKCLGKMRDVARGGRTVLFVSHNMAAIESLCTRAIYLEGGRLGVTGPISDVIEFYQERVRAESGPATPELTGGRYFRRLEIRDGAGTESPVISLGGDVIIDVVIEAESAVRHPRLYVAVDDLLGHRLITAQPAVNDESFSPLEGRVGFRCVLHDLPLAPGTYGITLLLAENRQTLEALRGIRTFTIENVPVFNEGRGHSRGTVIARSTWTSQAPAEEALETAASR